MNDKESLSNATIAEKQEDMVRVSASYLFSIMLNGKGKRDYLLVKSEKRDQFQPIGGCYKFYSSALPMLSKLSARPGNKFKSEEDVNDLRIVLPKSSLSEFEEWYYSGKDREVNCTRELDEELVRFVPEEFKPEFEQFYGYVISRGEFKPYFDEEYNMDSVKPMDIIGIDLNETQQAIVSKLVKKYPNRFLLASREEIFAGKKQLEAGKTVKIGDHTKKIVAEPEAVQEQDMQ